MSVRDRVGVAAVAVGLAFAALNAFPDAPQLLVALVAFPAAATAFLRLADRVVADGEHVPLPELDSGVSARIAGEEYRDASPQQRREHLRQYVTTLLVRERELTREEARDAVDAGRWTDRDPAAAYLSRSDQKRAPLRIRLRAWWDDEPLDQWWFERTVPAVAELAEGDEP